MRMDTLLVFYLSSRKENEWETVRMKPQDIERQKVEITSADYRPKLGRESTRYGTSPEPDDTTQSIFMG